MWAAPMPSTATSWASRRPLGPAALDKTRGYGGDVVFLSDGRIQHHLAQKDVVAGFRAGQTVNPVSHGHIAYRTDDMAAFLAHLDASAFPIPTGATRP
jgi:glyoxylase I family protein